MIRNVSVKPQLSRLYDSLRLSRNEPLSKSSLRRASFYGQ